jgi:uncharacterized GH25 family protein
MKRLTAFITFTLMTSLSWAAVIEGRVVHDGDPVAGVRVYLYRTLDYDAEPLFISEATDPQGYYQVEVSPGSYALFARHTEKELFAFCGRNPVDAREDTTWAGLQAVGISPVESVPYDDEYSAAVEGVVLFNGAPVPGAYVYLYLDVKDNLKGQGYRLSMPTGADGRFAFDGLPERE